jgi:hypothetical protein
MAGARSPDFKTPIARFSYVQHMFEPVARTNDDGTPMLDKNKKPVLELQCTLIFPINTDRSKFDEALKAVIVEQWGEEGLVRAKNQLIKTPYLAGDGPEARSKKTGELHPGMGPDVWFIRVATRILTCPVRYRSPTIPATKDEIKSGDYGFAALNAYAWETDKKSGVSFGIQYLQKVRDGEALGGGGGVDVDDYYEKIADEGAAPASTKTGAGAGGLFG